MKRLFSVALGLLLSVSLSGCINGGNAAQPNAAQPNNEGQRKAEPQQSDENDQTAVAILVESFGKKLQTVSLLAPRNTVIKSIQENYGDLVPPELLSKWLSDPQNAPGRLTSSPWPDRIEILSIKKLSDDAYEVQGEIIEITSVEKVRGGVAAKLPIRLVVEKINNRWLIAGYEPAELPVYKNTELGFSFLLPASWKGYQVVTDQWEGFTVGGPHGQETVQTGPMISIRHPQWTPQNRRQDIPIMVFTITQWNLLREGKFHIGAAPVGPRELGRNERYVFALPARYNYAFPPGYEEVESILAGNPLRATD